MIVVDETEPDGEVEPPFEPREVYIRRGQNVRDKFVLEQEIGRGKFGTVYNCHERDTGLRLAAKFVQASKKADRINVEREVEIMNSLRHPRLIQLYDAYDDGKKEICLLLELIEGGELFERVIDDDFILTERACAIFMRQICQGVEFIHQQSIVHLDMKPENILCLTKTGNRIKLIDFGLARRFDPSKKLQVLFGTPEFVAPEVVNFDQIGFGTDLWSVGIICYVLLSGLSPFMGESDVETMANVTIAKYDFDDEAFLDVSEEAKDFIAKLLVKQMSKRMTASECLRHPWLQPRPPGQTTMSSKVAESEEESEEEESEEDESEEEEEESTSVTATAGTETLDELKILTQMPAAASPVPSLAVMADRRSSLVKTPEPTLPAIPISPTPPVVPEVPVASSVVPVVPVVAPVPKSPVPPVPKSPVPPAVKSPPVPASPVPPVPESPVSPAAKSPRVPGSPVPPAKSPRVPASPVPPVPASPVPPVPESPLSPVPKSTLSPEAKSPRVPASPVPPVPVSPVPPLSPVPAAVPEVPVVPENDKAGEEVKATLSRSTTSEVLQLTKVNLRQFVERWNSHPNSPFMCDSPRRATISLLSPVNWSQMASRTSLTGMSPSPQSSWSASPSDLSPSPSPPLSPTTRRRLEELETFCHYQAESKSPSKSNSFDMDVNDNQFLNIAPVGVNHRIHCQSIGSETSPSSSLNSNNNAFDLLAQSNVKDSGPAGARRSSRRPSESENASKAVHHHHVTHHHHHNDENVESAIERTTILLKSVQETLMRQMESGTAVRDRTGARIWSRRGSNSSVGQIGSPLTLPKNPSHGSSGQSAPAAPSITATSAPPEPPKPEKKPVRPNTLDPNAGKAGKPPPPRSPPPPPPATVLDRWRGQQRPNTLNPMAHQPPRSPSPRSPVLDRWRNNQFAENSLDPHSAKPIQSPRSPPAPRSPPGAPVLDRWRGNNQHGSLHPNSAHPSRPPPPKSPPPPRSPPSAPVLGRWRNNNNTNNNNLNNLNQQQSPSDDWEVHPPVAARTMAAPKKHLVVNLSNSRTSTTKVSITAPSANSSEESSGTPTPTPLTPVTPSVPFIDDKKLPMAFKRNSAVIEN